MKKKPSLWLESIPYIDNSYSILIISNREPIKLLYFELYNLFCMFLNYFSNISQGMYLIPNQFQK